MAPLQFRNITYGTSANVKGSATMGDDGTVSWQSNISRDTKYALKKTDVKSIDWYPTGKVYQVKLNRTEKGAAGVRLTGFSMEHETSLKKWAEKSLGVPFKSSRACIEGGNWCDLTLKSSEMLARSEDRKSMMFSIDYRQFAQSIIQGKNELAFEFKAPSRVKPTAETLVEMRVHIPDDTEPPENPDEPPEAPYELFNRILTKKAKLGRSAGEIIASFKDVTLKVPRGKYDLDFFEDVFRLHGKTYNYKIKFTQIKRLFLFTLPTNAIAFLVALQPPIRQGQTTYSYLIMNFPDQEIVEARINATEEDMKSKYISKNGQQLLKAEMEGKTYDIVSRVFLALAKCKIITTKDYLSHYKEKCVKCSFGAETGLLYPLQKSFFFIFKPPTYIKHSEVQYVEFGRADGGGSGRLFDIHLHIKRGKSKKISFTNIAMHEFENIFEYCRSKKDTLNIMDEAKWTERMQRGARSGRQRRAAASNAIDSYKNHLTAEAEDDDEEEDDDFVPGGEDEEMLAADEDYDNESSDHLSDDSEEAAKKPKPKPAKANGKPKDKKEKKGKKRSRAEEDDIDADAMAEFTKKARTEDAADDSEDDAPIGS